MSRLASSPSLVTTQQALAHVVEAADGVEALLHLVKELHHRGPALGVLDRGDEAPGLVEDEVAQALGALEQLAVHADVVAAQRRPWCPAR